MLYKVHTFHISLKIFCTILPVENTWYVLVNKTLIVWFDLLWIWNVISFRIKVVFTEKIVNEINKLLIPLLKFSDPFQHL